MEKYWTIYFPGDYGQHVQETWSETQILKSYFDDWCSRARNAGWSPDQCTEQQCIEDWCAIHWAVRTNCLGNTREI